MIVLDTTVLVYAVGGEHPFREPCRELVDAVAGGTAATTTVEVLQELAHVWARRRGRDDAVRLARDYHELLAPLLVVGEDDLHDGLRLYARSERLGSFDAVLAATAGRANANAIVSADAAFAEADVAHVIPDAAGVAGLLGR
jgi:predicted nucleic acid-binding protein